MELKVDHNTVIVFDLDDTLVYEIDFLYSAYCEIATILEPQNKSSLVRHLFSLYRNNENPFQFLESNYDMTLESMLSIYRNHAPESLEMLPNCFQVIKNIKENNGKVAIITDGRSITQRNKIKAIGILDMLDEIIISEEINSEKPNALNYNLIEDKFPDSTYYYIGDNIKKDFITPNGLGWKTVQILDTGKNIHVNTKVISDKHLPKHIIHNFSEIKINNFVMQEKIWLSSPHMGGSERNFVTEAFDTNWVAPLGPNVNGFEQDIANYLKEDVYVGALSSGTAGLHLGLILLGVEAGDEVLCQSMTFSASANPILYQGAIPIFIDSEPDTWNLCPVHLENAIKDRISLGKKPKAIIAVHLYGMPYKVEEISEISKRYNIPVLEDSAEALGSSYNGQKCGTFGDISVLSFNGNKIITTSGGGAIISKNKSVIDKAIFLATQARDDAPHYQHSHIGYNYRLSNISAGIGRGQMEVLDKHVNLRQDMNTFYKKLFKDVPAITVFSEPSSSYISNHWLTSITLDKNKASFIIEDLRLALLEENIESRPLWKPMHLQPIFAEYPFYGTKVAESLFDNGLCLPSGSSLTNDDRARITNVVSKFIQ